MIGNGINNIHLGYGLYVSKGILTEKVKVAVKNTNDWTDKVFSKGYPLKNLREVGQYILANQHLPGLPSAEEVVKEGLDVVKMNAKLLEKIEELTLHVLQQLQQQRQIHQLQQRTKQHWGSK